MNRVSLPRWAIGMTCAVAILMSVAGLTLAFQDPHLIGTDEVIDLVEGMGVPVEVVMIVGLAVPLIASIATGVFIFIRRPRDLLAMSFALMLITLASFSTRGLTALASWEPAFAPLTFLISMVGATSFIYVFLVFPHGRLGRRAAMFWLVATALIASNPDSLDALVTRRDASDMGLQEQLYAGGLAAVFLILAVLQAVRYRRAQSLERLQIKWVMLPIAAIGSYVALVILLPSLFFELPPAWFGAALVCSTPFSLAFPICIARGVLKYRLYDIDLVVKKTLLYGALTAILGFAYLVLVVSLQALADPLTSDSDLAIAASTLAVAAMFRPLRIRLQAFIDRRFFRNRYNAQRTLEGFSSRLRESVELDRLVTDIAGVVGETMQPSHVSIWLRSSKAMTP